jgi:small neutral amino acid transporter SnatA (MarC family)
MMGEWFFRRLGKTGSGLIAQIMALLLATIAVQFVRSGLAALWAQGHNLPR